MTSEMSKIYIDIKRGCAFIKLFFCEHVFPEIVENDSL